MLKSIRNSRNGYLQGLIFLINLPFRYLRHQLLLREGNLKFGAKKWDLGSRKTSDTLFILGSGASIAQYKKSQFSEISKHDSIGFNFWLLHPFVPTYYVAEFLPNSIRSELLWKNLCVRASDYSHTSVILKYSKTLWKEKRNIPKSLQNIFLSSHISIPGNSTRTFSRWLGFLEGVGALSGKLFNGFIVFRQASISWLIVFALRLNYKNIILCGVDLNSSDYFYEIDQSFVQERGLFEPPSEFESNVHPTNDASKCDGLTISQILAVMEKKILRKRGVKLFVGAEQSALYPQLPVYKWSD